MPRPDHALESVKVSIKALEEKFDLFVADYESPLNVLGKQLWRSGWKILGGLGALAAIIVLFLPYIDSSVSRWADARTDEKLKQPLSDLGANRDDVKSIKGRLDELSPLIHDWIRGQMQKNSHLPTAEFRQKLPEISKTLEVAKELKVDIPQPVLQAVNAKFAEILKNGPIPWGEKLQVLGYRSVFNAVVEHRVTLNRLVGNGTKPFFVFEPGSSATIDPVALERYDQTLDNGTWNGVVFIDCTTFSSSTADSFSTRFRPRENSPMNS